jgi:hypothetical protein
MMLKAQDRIKARWIPAGFTVFRQDADAIVYSGKKIMPMGERVHGIAYQGTALKPFWNYTFLNDSQLNAETERFFEKCRAMREYREEKAKARREFVPTLKAGDILDTCWGYDQTNVEFYQVIRVSGKTAVLREIAQKSVNATGPYSGTVTAVKDQFLEKEPEITRRILPGNCIRITECASASLWNGEPAYCSWGA